MLLKHVAMPWSHCKLASYFVFKCWTFSNKRDQIKHKLWELNVKYSWTNTLSLHLAFWSQDHAYSVKTKQWQARSCLARIFVNLCLIITYYATFFQDSVKLYQDKAPGKSDFVIKDLSAPWLWEHQV